MSKNQIDPIVSEVQAVREAHAARFDYNLAAIFRDTRRMQEESGGEYIRLPPRIAGASEGAISKPGAGGISL